MSSPRAASAASDEKNNLGAVLQLYAAREGLHCQDCADATTLDSYDPVNMLTHVGLGFEMVVETVYSRTAGRLAVHNQALWCVKKAMGE